MAAGSEAVRLARLVPAALLSGMAGGAVAGLGARVLMFVIRLSNPAFSGATTHEGYLNGRWTVEGTVNLVVTGMFFGVIGGPIYLLLRRFLGPSGLGRGLLAGVLMLIAFGSDILDGSYEFSRFVSPRITVPAFACLYLVYGLVLAALADRIAPPKPMRHRGLRIIGTVVLIAVAAAGAWQLVTTLRFRYQF